MDGWTDVRTDGRLYVLYVTHAKRRSGALRYLFNRCSLHSGAVVLPNGGRIVPNSGGPGAAEGAAQTASAAAAGAAATSPALATCTGAESPQALPSGGLMDPNMEEDPAAGELSMGGRTEPNTVVTECTEAHSDAGGTTKPEGGATGCAATDAFP